MPTAKPLPKHYFTHDQVCNYMRSLDHTIYFANLLRTWKDGIGDQDMVTISSDTLEWKYEDYKTGDCTDFTLEELDYLKAVVEGLGENGSIKILYNS